MAYKKSPDDKFYIPEQFKDTKGEGDKKQVKKPGEIMVALTSYRYKREGTTNGELISTQNRLEQLVTRQHKETCFISGEQMMMVCF